MNFCALPDHILMKVVSFLEYESIYLKCALVCKYMLRFISTNKNIPTELIYQSIGFYIQEKILNRYSYQDLLQLFKSITAVSTSEIELPFYGYSSDGGCDGDDERYLFNKVFKATNSQSICTETGEKFWIKGALAYDYFDYNNLSRRNNHYLENEELEDIQEYLDNKNEDINFMLQTMPLIKKNIELQYKTLSRVGIIKSIKISRSGYFSCPVKTLMIFSSLEEINDQDQLFQAFKECHSENRISQLYLSKNKNEIPAIKTTSIDFLAKFSDTFYDPPTSTKFIIFSNKYHGKVKPILWLKFESNKKKIFEYHFDWSNYFITRYSIAILYNCDDKMEEMGDIHEATNIDIKYISLRGLLLDLNMIL